AETTSRPEVTYSDALAPIERPNRPAIRKPASGRKTMAWYMLCRSALHRVDVFDGDRAADTEEGDEDRQPDRCLGSRDREDEQGKDLPHEISEGRRERHEIDIHREQDQFDRHQDDDHVLAVEEDAEHAHREHHGGE